MEVALWRFLPLSPFPPPNDHHGLTCFARLRGHLSLPSWPYGVDPAQITSCEHTFEYKAIQSHLRAHNDCPMCRRPVQGIEEVSRPWGPLVTVREWQRVVFSCEG